MPPGVEVIKAREGDPIVAAAALMVARTSLLMRARFPADERYERAFAVLQHEAVWIAVEGEVVRGVLVMRNHGRSPFSLGPARLTYGWFRVWRHQILESITSGRAVHIAAFWTAPELRGQGLGTAMLQAALPDNARVTLFARPGREAFYSRHGFRNGGSLRMRLIGRISGMSPMHRPVAV